MKIKTFVAGTPAEIDRIVNDFESKNDVKATQTDVYTFQGVIHHKATVFYNGPVPQQQSLNM